MSCELPKPPHRLIALSLGFSSYASPIDCGDLTGPASLFGRFVELPKPLYSFFVPPLLGLNAGEHAALQDSLILSDASYGKPSKNPFSLLQTTYIASTVNSTFDLAWRLHELGLLPAWGAVLALKQNTGRGQMRKIWDSPPGNLYVSFRLPSLKLFQKDAVAIIVGIMLTRVLEDLGFLVRLKWPNDLMSLEGEKIGGILVEERDGVIIAGVGINLIPVENNEFASSHNPSYPIGVLRHSSTGIEAKSELVPFFLWQKLIAGSIIECQKYLAVTSLHDILQKGSEKLAWLHKKITVFENDTEVCSGLCLGLSENGGLLVSPASGIVEEITSGTVRLQSA